MGNIYNKSEKIIPDIENNVSEYITAFIYIINKPKENNIQIEQVYNDFSEDLPTYFLLDNYYNFKSYLICVKYESELLNICKKYNYKVLHNPYKIKVLKSEFNSNYIIKECYDNNDSFYKLEKIS